MTFTCADSSSRCHAATPFVALLMFLTLPRVCDAEYTATDTSGTQGPREAILQFYDGTSVRVSIIDELSHGFLVKRENSEVSEVIPYAQISGVMKPAPMGFDKGNWNTGAAIGDAYARPTPAVVPFEKDRFLGEQEAPSLHPPRKGRGAIVAGWVIAGLGLIASEAMAVMAIAGATDLLLFGLPISGGAFLIGLSVALAGHAVRYRAIRRWEKNRWKEGSALTSRDEFDRRPFHLLSVGPLVFDSGAGVGMAAGF